jgi:hypothetical protein
MSDDNQHARKGDPNQSGSNDAPEDEHDTPMADELAGLAEEVRRLERQTTGEVAEATLGRYRDEPHELTVLVSDGRESHHSAKHDLIADGGVDARDRDDFEEWHSGGAQFPPSVEAHSDLSAAGVRDTLLRSVEQLAGMHRAGAPAGSVLDLTTDKTGASTYAAMCLLAECIAEGEVIETESGDLRPAGGDEA